MEHVIHGIPFSRGSRFALFAFAILLASSAGFPLMGSPLTATFTSANYATGATPNVLAVGDFNRDGAKDVVVTAGTSVVALMGGPGGTLGTYQTSTFVPGSSCANAGAGATIRNVVFGNSTDHIDYSPVFWLTTVGSGLMGHIETSSGVPVTAIACDNAAVNSSPAAFLWMASGDFDSYGDDPAAAVLDDPTHSSPNIYFTRGTQYGTYPLGLANSSYIYAVPLPNGLVGAATVATGDFNGDGRPDVVAAARANSGAAATNVAFFPAQKALSPGITTAASIFTTATAGSVSIGGTDPIKRILIADATGDGKADIVVTTDHSVVVLPGNGSGAFGSPVTLSIPASTANAAAVGDFNGDGYPDLAVATSTGILMFYGTGPSGGVPTFASPQTVGSVSSANDIVAADMDLDGRPDLVVSSADGNVCVLLNQTPFLKVSSSQALQLLAVAGKPFSGHGTVTIATSDSGTVPALGVGAAPNSPDLSGWVALSAASNQVTIAPNIAQAPGPGVYSGLAAVSGSGYRNLLIPYTVTIVRPSGGLLRGGASGTQATGMPGAAGQPQVLAVGDFNGDGLPEIASNSSYTLCTGGYTWCDGVYTRRADGTAYNVPASTVPRVMGGSSSQAIAADFNRDGKLDAAFIAGSTVTIDFGDGAGGFPNSRFYSIPYVMGGQNEAAVADLNGDGYPDLVIAGYTALGSPVLMPSGVVVLLNDGFGGFSQYTLGAGNKYDSLAVADFNADGIPDIAARNTSGSTLDLFIGLGGGRFAAPQHLSFPVPGCTGAGCSLPTAQNAAPDPESMVAGDFNGDGLIDLAFTDRPPSSAQLKPSVDVLLASVDSSHNVTFTIATNWVFPSYQSTALPYRLTAADVDGDGKIDLGFYRYGVGLLTVLPGNGDGTFGTAIDYGSNGVGNFYLGTVSINSGLVFADLDGDGRTDLIGQKDANDTNGSQVGIAMGTPGPATTMTLGGLYPMPVTAGTPENFSVQLWDASNSLATTYAGTVHFTSSDGSATKPSNYTFTPADGGAHTFIGGATFRTAGQQTLTATDTAHSSLTATLSITVQAGAVSSVTLSSPPSAPINTAFSLLTAHVTDAYNNAVAGATVTFSSTGGGSVAGGTFSNGGTATTNGSGDATITVTANSHVGTFTVQANAGGVLSNTPTLTIAYGPATHFAVSGFPSPTVSGSAHSIAVTALDASNDTVLNYTGTVAFSSSDAHPALPNNYPFLLSNSGTHTFSGVILRTPGSQSITVTDASNSSIAGAQILIQVQPLPAALVPTGTPQSAAVGSAFATTLSVKVVDASTPPSRVLAKPLPSRRRAAEQAAHSVVFRPLRRCPTQREWPPRQSSQPTAYWARTAWLPR